MATTDVDNALDQDLSRSLRIDSCQVKRHEHNDREPQDKDVGHLPVLSVPFGHIGRLFWALSLDLGYMLEMKHLHHLLQVTDLVREQLHNCLKATHFAQLAHDQEEGFHLCGYFVSLSSYGLPHVNLKESHDGRDKSIQDCIEDAGLLLIFLQHSIDTVSKSGTVLFALDTRSHICASLMLLFSQALLIENFRRFKVDVL